MKEFFHLLLLKEEEKLKTLNMFRKYDGHISSFFSSGI